MIYKAEKMDSIFYTPLEQWLQQRQRLIALSERLLVLLEALEMPELQSEVRQLLQKLYADKLRVLVVGKGNRGKSTVINALIGQRVLPAYPVPTTALLSVVTWGEQPGATLHFHPSQESLLKPPQAISFADLERYLVIEANIEHAEQYERVELYCPLPLCSMGVDLIDSPALDDDERYLRATMRRVPTADVVLFVLACDTLPSREESLEIEKIMRARDEGIFFLCNRFDLVELPAQGRMKRRWLTYLSQFNGHSERSVFFTNAKGALTGRLVGSQKQLEHSNLSLVEEALYTFLARRGGERLRGTATWLQMVTRKMMSISEAQQLFAGALEDELVAIEQALEDASQGYH